MSRSLTLLLVLLLAAQMHVKAQDSAASGPAFAAEQVPFLKVAGRLQPAGEFPAREPGATVSALDGGALFVYGDDRSGGNALLSPSARRASLKYRRLDVNVRGALSGPKLWNPSARFWRTLDESPACQGAGYLHTATVMPGNKVLIAGGLCGIPRMADDPTPQAEHTATSIWDQDKQRWELGPKLLKGRIHHTASLLSNGTVLIVGGESDPALGRTVEQQKSDRPDRPSSTEEAAAAAGLEGGLVDVTEHITTRDSASSLPPNTLRARHTATVLPRDQVLITGGVDASGRATAQTEIWSPDTRMWVTLEPMLSPRHSHSATLLADGRVLVVGGVGLDGTVLSSAEIWNPSTRTWTFATPLPVPLKGHTASLLPTGQVLMAGGSRTLGFYPLTSGWWDGNPIVWAWLWEPGTAAWHAAGTAIPTEGWLATQVAIVPKPGGEKGGGAMVFANQIMRWEPIDAALAPYRSRASPVWKENLIGPWAAALSDGRVMFVGKEARSERDPWTAHLWNPATDEWVDAGDVPSRAWSTEARALQLPSGRVILVGIGNENNLVCSSWTPEPDRPAAGTPAWSSCGDIRLEYEATVRPGLALLRDGRAAVRPTSQEVFVFDEAANTWNRWQSKNTDFGAEGEDGKVRTDGLTYGAPIRSAQPLAEILDPATGQWQEINALAAQYWMQLFPRRDYAVIGANFYKQVKGRGRPPSLFWDSKAQHWTYVFKGRMGHEVHLLPDGCVLSMKPLAVFQPLSGNVVALQDPGFGVQQGRGDSLVLPDGTLVVAGPTWGAKDPGSGFFRGKVSCDGFAKDAIDPGYVAAQHMSELQLATALAASAAASAASAAAAAKAEAAAEAAAAHPLAAAWKWITAAWQNTSPMLVLAVLGPLAAFFVFRRLGWQQFALGPSWTLRILIYGLMVLFVAPALWSYLAFHRAAKEWACAEDAKACLQEGGPGAGLLKPSTGGSAESSIPCSHVGVWSSRQGNVMHRITLNDDGTYRMEPNAAGFGSGTPYTGHWAVQGQNMVWRHDQGMRDGLDVNPMKLTDRDHFTLTESDGAITKYELIRRVPSSTCKP